MFFVSALCSVYDNIKDEPTENHTEKSDSNSGSQKEWQNNKKINNNQKKKTSNCVIQESCKMVAAI